MSQRLDEIEQHVLSIDANTSDDDKIDKLARDIYATLPVRASESDMPRIKDVLREELSEMAMAQQISTPYIWSEFFNASIADTRRACARMLDYFLMQSPLRRVSTVPGRMQPCMTTWTSTPVRTTRTTR